MDAERAYKDLIWQDADRMSGAVCFFGTRIPVSMMFDYLENGHTLEQFEVDQRIPMKTLRSVLELASTGLQSYLEPAA